MNKVLLLAATVLVALLGVTGSALAATGFERVGSFSDAAPDLQPAHQHRIAVNQASGDVYVTNPINDRVDVYRPGGSTATALTSFGAGGLTDPFGIAIDQATGDVYVSDDNDVVRYTSDGAATPTFTLDNTFTSPGVTGPLAFDATANQLLVGDRATNTVRRYGATGTAGATFDGSAGTGSPGAFAGIQDLAVDSTGDVIVVDATGNPAHADGSVSRVERFAANGGWETTIGTVNQASTVAVRPVNDDVLISGDQNTVYSGGTPTVHVFTSAGTERPQPAIDGALSYATISGLAVDDGPTGHIYVASDNGDYVASPDQYKFGYTSVQIYTPFEIPLPDVTVGEAKPMQHGAAVFGTVDPNGVPTTWTVEYGKTTTYGSQAPATPADAGAGNAAIPVDVRVIHLDPGTIYHYRLTATNASGTVQTPDHIFATQAATVDGGRDGSRSYELVTPPDKQGNALSPSGTVQSAPDGNAIAFSTTGAFAGAEANMLRTYYLSRRSAGGWSTQAIDPPQRNLTTFQSLPTRFFSSDLSVAAQLSSRSLVSGGVDGGSNLYRTDTATGARALMLGSSAEDAFGFRAETNTSGSVSGSDDLSHYVFTSDSVLAPDGVLGQNNVYEWFDGHVRLVSRRPDGSAASRTTFGGRLALGGLTSRAVSRDGRRIAFIDGNAAGAPLYLRIDGTTTVPVSASKRSGADPDAAPANAAPVGMSADGSIIYFTSAEYLTDADQGGLYRFDVDDDTLTLETPLRPDDVFGSAEVGGVAVSQDGETVVLSAVNDLTGGHPTGDYFSENQNNLYVLHDGELQWIGARSLMDAQDENSQYILSPNGRYLAFTSNAQLSGYDNRNAECSFFDIYGQDLDTCSQTYVWDTETQRLSCPSCAQGASSPGQFSPARQPQTVSRYVPRVILDDGTLFFTTAAPLVGQDSNGKSDVYKWHAGAVSLISSGGGSADASLVDATPDGKDVYFRTSGRLVGIDTDDSVDLYDARVGGGIAAQNPAPRIDATCTGDACQGTPRGGDVPPASIGSVDFTGPGNEPADPDKPVTAKATVTASRTVRGSRFSITVKAPAAGTVKVSGSGLVSGTKRLASAGIAKVTVTLTRKAKEKLRKRRSVRVRARVSYTQAGQSASTTTVSVTLKA